MKTLIKLNRIWLLIIALSVIVVPSYALQSYSGTIYSGAGLIGQGSWSTGVSLYWQVTQKEEGYWHYYYNLTVARKNISHIIIERSFNTTAADFFNVSSSYLVEEYRVGNGNPGLPDQPFYGIKSDVGYNTLNYVFYFDSWRRPMWGDFYAKDGKTDGIDNIVYNEGFRKDPITGRDWDPDINIYPARDGAFMGHILVPDTESTSHAIPEAGSLFLGAIGLMPLVAYKYKRRLK